MRHLGTTPMPDDTDEELGPSERIAVLIRHDFLIDDLEALIAAGRAAYLRMRPDDIESVESDVQTADDAIHEIMHASCEDTILEGVPGLRPTASIQTTRDVSEPLDFDDPFAVY